MCCGGGSSTTSQTTTNLPAGYQDALNYITGHGKTLAQEQFPVYGAPRVAPFSADTQAAFDATRANQGVYQPSLTNATALNQMAGQQTPNVNLGAYMNPYQQYVTDIAKREAVRQDDISRVGRNQNAVAAGAFGGDRQAIIEAEAQRNLGQRLDDLQLMGGQAGFQSALAQLNADREAALRAGDQSLNIGAGAQRLGLTDAAAMQTIGAAQEGKTQQNLDVLRQDFLEQRDYPRNLLTWYANLLKGQQTLGATQTTTQPPPSTASQLGGLGLLALSAYGQFKAKGGLVRPPGYAKGGLVKLAKGGKVKRNYADGGLVGLRLPELNYMMSTLPQGDPRRATIQQEIQRRNQVIGGAATPTGVPNRPTLTDLVNKINPNRSDAQYTPEMEGALSQLVGPAQDRDLEATRGVSRGPLPSEPAPQAALATRVASRPEPSFTTGAPAQPSVPVGDALVSNLPTAPEVQEEAPAQPDWLQRNSIPIAAAGARMMAARSGENFLQSAGEGILGGLKMSNELTRATRKEALEEREISRKEREDVSQAGFKDRALKIDEAAMSGKMSLQEAQAAYYRAYGDYLQNNKGLDADLKGEQIRSLIDQRMEGIRQRKNEAASNVYKSGMSTWDKAASDPINSEMPGFKEQYAAAEKRARENVIRSHPDSDLARNFVMEDAERAKRITLGRTDITDEEKQTKLKEIDARVAKFVGK